MEAVLGSLRNLSSGSGVAVVRLLLELPATSALMPEAKVSLCLVVGGRSIKVLVHVHRQRLARKALGSLREIDVPMVSLELAKVKGPEVCGPTVLVGSLPILMGRPLLALATEVAEGLASVVHDLAGALDEVVDERYYLHRLLVLVEVTGLALLIAIPNVLFKEAWVDSVHDLETKVKSIKDLRCRDTAC